MSTPSPSTTSAPIRPNRLRDYVNRGKKEFQSADPFEHVVIDDFLDVDFADAVLKEFQATISSRQEWAYYHHYNEKKRGLSDLTQMGPMTQKLFSYFHSREFVAAMEEMTGISGLLSDPDMDGAGIYETPPGGYLNMHIDFLSHRKRKTWSRQLNLIYFLNKDWKEEFNGHLELWDPGMTHCVKKVLPVFNRCVIFHTSKRAFHGVPRPIACPETNSRKSIALYFYRDEGQRCKVIPTYYAALPNDPAWKKTLVFIDRMAVGVYSYLQRGLGFSDRATGSLLRFFR